MGDIPIYVGGQSADVWAYQKLFELDTSGQPTAVSGVPPDAFSETGQLWGSPLYDWKARDHQHLILLSLALEAHQCMHACSHSMCTSAAWWHTCAAAATAHAGSTAEGFRVSMAQGR